MPPRCPKGYKRDKKTGECVPNKKTAKMRSSTSSSRSSLKIPIKVAKGTRKNKKQNLIKILEERRTCIQKWRE